MGKTRSKGRRVYVLADVFGSYPASPSAMDCLTKVRTAEVSFAVKFISTSRVSVCALMSKRRQRVKSFLR